MAVSFIDGGNRSSLRKPPTSRKSLKNLYQVHLDWAGFELTTLLVMGTDWIGNCKSNYHTITTTTIPDFHMKNSNKRLIQYWYFNKSKTIIICTNHVYIPQRNILPTLVSIYTCAFCEDWKVKRLIDHDGQNLIHDKSWHRGCLGQVS